MDPVKEAFAKVKQDMQFLQEQIVLLHEELGEINRTLSRQTDRHINQTDLDTSTDTQTHKTAVEAPIAPFPQTSTGNEGVSTDRQTIRQTDNGPNQAQNQPQNPKETHTDSQENSQEFALSAGDRSQNKFQEATEAIQALEAIQGNIKAQIESLTPQEFAVFTHIYQHNLQETQVDYRKLAQEFGLTESSIRDHVKGLITKGIPVEKVKHNNKKITLKVAETLQKIASLDALLVLREQNKSVR
jgi:DNA-binding MarR family transcriptional regulator